MKDQFYDKAMAEQQERLAATTDMLDYTSGVDLQTMWAHFLMPIDVIVSG